MIYSLDLNIRRDQTWKMLTSILGERVYTAAASGLYFPDRKSSSTTAIAGNGPTYSSGVDSRTSADSPTAVSPASLP